MAIIIAVSQIERITSVNDEKLPILNLRYDNDEFSRIFISIMLPKFRLPLLGIVLSFSLMMMGCTASTEQTTYQPLELSEVQGELTGDDPSAIALTLFGMKEPMEGQFSEEISVIESEGFKRTLLLTQMNLTDDSVKGIRYRLNFEFDQGQGKWQLVSGGRQFTCYRGESPDQWTTELCP
jgi:hypothetical protein